jgi:hypothetical protein
MTLPAAWAILEADFDSLSEHLGNFAGSKTVINSSNNFTALDEFLLEGMLSQCWQAWCRFCRTCVMESCLGTITSTGTVVQRLPQATRAELVSGAAIRAKQQANPPYWGRSNFLLRAEPTWGDTDVLVKILTRLAPTNSAQLLAAFSSGSSYAKAIQTIRNTVAHDNIETRTELQRLQSAYIVFPITHPTQALFWIEPTSNDYLINDAIETLKAVAAVAIS